MYAEAVRKVFIDWVLVKLPGGTQTERVV